MFGIFRSHRSRRSLAIAAASVFCTTAISIHPVGAQDVTPTQEDPALQRIAVSYYVGKYRVDPEEAQRRLAVQDRASGIEDELARLLGDQYAGIWYDHSDRGRLKIGLTRRAEAHLDRVRSLLDRYGIAAETDLVAVRYSVAELETRQHAIRNRIAGMIESAHASTSYNTRLNKVVVTAIAELSADEAAKLKVLGELPEVSIRRVEVSSLAGKPLSCNITFCDPPLRGGREMIGKHGLCTIAFVARDRIDPGRFWALTAGHCIYLTGDTSWSARDEMGRVILFGTAAFYTYADTSASGADAGIVSINGPCNFCYWFNPPPIPAVVVKGSGQTTYDPNYAIHTTSFSSLGQILCRTGRTTGTECGEVSNLGADETQIFDGVLYYMRNMGELDVCGAESGDSGGPLYKRGRAFGIYSGGADAGPAYCFESYQGVRGAEKVMNVDVLLTP